MRKAGYVLVGRKWVSKRVAEKDYLEEELWKIVRKCVRVEWYSLLPKVEHPMYDDLVNMTEEEWHQFQREDVETWNTKEKRRAGRARWDFVNMRRAARQHACYAPSGTEGSRAKQLLALREDYHENPEQYFDTEFDFYIAVEAIEEELRSLPAGRWRFAAVLQQEKEEQTKWQSANKIQKVFRGWKVRRGEKHVSAGKRAEVSAGKRVLDESWKKVLERVEGI